MLIRKGSKSLYDYCQEHPDKLYLLEEWDYEENNKLGITPKLISYGSTIKVNWICRKNLKHKWQAAPNDRKRGNGCPVCSGLKIVIGENDLASKNPELAAEWHPIRNGNLKPTDVTVSANKKVWWLCPICGHEWQALISSRNDNRGCPSCRKTGTSFPELAIYFYFKKIYPDVLNSYKIKKTELDIFIPSLNLAIEYDGFAWHKDKLDRDNKKDEFCKDNRIRLIRLRGEGLQKTTLAENIFIKEAGIKNKKTTIITLFNYLNIDYDFKIDLDEDYKEIMYIKQFKIINDSLAVKFPDIAAEWHPTRNGNLKPENFHAFAQQKIWWKCPICGHEWQSTIANRSSHHGCPSCTKKLKWTEEELDVLLKHYPTCGPRKCKEILKNKTIEAISQKAHLLGLKYISPHSWSEEDIKILKEWYPIEGPEIVNRLPHKSLKAIQAKAYKLKLKIIK